MRHLAGTVQYSTRRSQLALRGTPEWSTVVDLKQVQTGGALTRRLDECIQGVIYYVNNVTEESQWDMPEAMDTFGRCHSLVSLKLNDNRLRSLPQSLAEATQLKLIECKNNYLNSLPTDLGELSNLTALRVTFTWSFG